MVGNCEHLRMTLDRIPAEDHLDLLLSFAQVSPSIWVLGFSQYPYFRLKSHGGGDGFHVGGDALLKGIDFVGDRGIGVFETISGQNADDGSIIGDTIFDFE